MAHGYKNAELFEIYRRIVTTLRQNLESAQRQNLISMTDTRHLSVPQLMRAQMQAEWELAHTHWLPMPPPQPGSYLVRAEIRDEDRKVTMKSVRLDWYDGKIWPRMGGYVSYTGWMRTPAV